MAAFVAGGEAAEVVEPGEGAFHDVADSAEAGSVGFTSASDAVLDAACCDESSVFVVAAVGVQRRWLVAWSADPAGYARDAIEQWHQLSDIATIAGRFCVGKRRAEAIDDHVVFRARFTAVDWARARCGALFFACT